MYPDPNRVRNYRIAINLDKYEHDLIVALSNFSGIDKSRLVREMLMKEAKRLLLDTENTQGMTQNPVPHS